jgi:hypothetical protein
MDSFILGLIVIAIIIGAYKAYQGRDADEDVKNVEQLPASVQNVISRMDTNSQNAFFLEYNKTKKKLFVSYILWFVFALYYAYNKKIGLQFIFWFTFGGLWVWWIIDLFRMPSIVRDTNASIAREIANTLALGNTFNER